MRLHRERHIVEGGEIAKQRGDLERARQTELAAPIDRQRGDVAAVEPDTAAVGRDFAGQLTDQRGLAGAVRTDDRVQFAGTELERNRIRRHHAAETLGQSFDLQHRLSHGAPPESNPSMPPLT